ncbi:MAG: hypothetical protein OEY86_11305 [Nitrospira sp.]|nr:hypothetical protein [Nitrospira sp.]
MIRPKRFGFRRFGIICHDTKQRTEHVLLQTPAPIHALSLRNTDELIVSVHTNGNMLCRVLSLHHPLDSPLREFCLSGVMGQKFMPKSLGYIKQSIICDGSECFTEFRAITAEGDFLIGPRYPGRILLGPCMSEREDLLAFSDNDNIYLEYLSTGKQLAFPYGKSGFCNWSENNILLACSGLANCFVLIDSSSREAHAINPVVGMVGHGVVSPSGRYVAYWTWNKDAYDDEEMALYLYSGQNGSHRKLRQWAMINAARWGQTERYLSISGVKKRDLGDFNYGRKMRNAYTQDWEIIDLNRSICAHS